MSNNECELPEEFYLKGAERVRQGFGPDGPGLSMIDLEIEYEPSQLGTYLKLVSELIVPSDDKDEPSILESYKRKAIHSSGLLVLQSYFESDFPEPLATNTMREFSLGFLPIEFLTADEPKRYTAFAARGRNGIFVHREALPLINEVWQFFAESTQSEAIASLATDSMGFTLTMLDRAWKISRDRMLASQTVEVPPEPLPVATDIDEEVQRIICDLNDDDWAAILKQN